MVQRVSTISACIVLICATAQLTLCQKNTKPDKNCELTAADYAVCAALLQGLGGPEDPEESWRGKDFLLVDTTIAQQGSLERGPKQARWGFRSKSNDVPHDDTVSDFITKKADRCELEAGFGDAKSYTIVASAEIEGYFPKQPKHKKDGWQAFYEKHPNAGGFWSFSRPGFNTAGDEALVYVVHSCGWLCGTGHYYLLAKESDVWKVKNRVMLWIS